MRETAVTYITSLIFGFSWYFGISDGLSKRLIQEVKSPTVL